MKFLIVLLFALSPIPAWAEIEAGGAPGMLIERPRRIHVKSEHQQCQKDVECTVVTTECDTCQCYGAPVNKRYETIYLEKMASLCTRDKPLNCDLPCPYNFTRCKNKMCLSEVPYMRGWGEDPDGEEKNTIFR